MWLRWLSAFAISIQRWFYIKVIAAKSNILRNKWASVMGIRITLTCFQTLRPRNRIFSSTTIDTTSMVQILPNGKSLDFDYLKSRQRRCYKMNSASAVGNQGWSRTQPKLVCCEAWWLRGNKSSLNDLHVVYFRVICLLKGSSWWW